VSGRRRAPSKERYTAKRSRLPITYTLGNGWKLVDGFYFAVATLTTSSVANPDLVLHDDWLKVFTAFYVLTGIGVLVEIARRIGRGFVEVHQQDRGRGGV
jgi:Ion channel